MNCFKYTEFSEFSPHVETVQFLEDGGEKYILIRFCIKLYSKALNKQQQQKVPRGSFALPYFYSIG